MLDIRYADFFERVESYKPRRKNWRDDMEADTEEVPEVERPFGSKGPEAEEEIKESTDLFEEPEEKEDEYLSTFERQQIRTKKTIANLEKDNIGEKKWALKGEVSSKTRPLNSLLEEDFEIEQASKPAPVIDEEKTQTLDDLIIQRIKDKAFDDVVRKAPPKDSQFDPNRRFELNDQKSQKSLAQVYEDEFNRQNAAVAPTTEKDVAHQKQHDEIDGLFTSLCTQLDALSNYHYAPKDATMELTVLPQANVPAISLEEVTPATVSDAMLAAPKEIYDTKVAKSQAEMDASDKKKARLRAKRIVSADKTRRAQAQKLIEKETGTQAQMTKETAVKKLMKQGNVTIIANNSKDKKMLDKKGGKASVIAKDGKVKQDRKVERPEMLRL
jgi:U3 small nucleolar RNA-associated protein MPP10